jgi:hypothetical protein
MAKLVNHRAVREILRPYDGYKALSNAIREQVDTLAPKTPSSAQMADLLCGLADNGELYDALNSGRREMLRTILWTDAVYVISGNPDASVGSGKTRESAAMLATNSEAVAFARGILTIGESAIDNEEAF